MTNAKETILKIIEREREDISAMLGRLAVRVQALPEPAEPAPAPAPLAGVLEKAREALRLLEWSSTGRRVPPVGLLCPACYRGKLEGHVSGCWLDAALAAIESYKPEPLPEAVREVVKELREVNDDDGWHEHIADRLMAAVFEKSREERLADDLCRLLLGFCDETASRGAVDTLRGLLDELRERRCSAPDRLAESVPGGAEEGACARTVRDAVVLLRQWRRLTTNADWKKAFGGLADDFDSALSGAAASGEGTGKASGEEWADGTPKMPDDFVKCHCGHSGVLHEAVAPRRCFECFCPSFEAESAPPAPAPSADEDGPSPRWRRDSAGVLHVTEAGAAALLPFEIVASDAISAGRFGLPETYQLLIDGRPVDAAFELHRDDFERSTRLRVRPAPPPPAPPARGNAPRSDEEAPGGSGGRAEGGSGRSGAPSAPERCGRRPGLLECDLAAGHDGAHLDRGAGVEWSS